jgi:integrase
MGQPVEHYGKWRIRWTDHSGVRQSAVFPTRREAKQALQLVESDVQRVKLGLLPAPPPSKSFADLADYWHEFKLPSIASWKTQRSHLSLHLVPFFGDMPLRLISVEEVRRFSVHIKHRRGGRKGGKPLSDKTVHHVLTTLTTMLNEAVELGWLLRAPRIPKPRLQSADFQFLQSLEEIASLVYAAREELDGTEALYATAAYSGLRAGELAGLRVSRVDLERRLITVAASYDKPTKSRRVRHVPILDSLLPLLRRWLLQVEGPLVFPNTAENMRQPSDRIFQETFHRCLHRAGLPRMRFHDLRHTFASHWVLRGGDLFKLQKILGHSNPQMTMRYAHLKPEAFSEDWGLMGEGRGSDDGHVMDFPGTGTIANR